MSQMLSVGQKLRSGLARSLEVFEQDGDVERIVIDLVDYVCDAVDELERRSRGETSVGTQEVSQVLNIHQCMVDACDVFEDEGGTLLNIRLDKMFDYARVPGDLPHVFDARVPFADRPRPKWDADRVLAGAFAQVLNLPPVQNVSDLSGQPIRARLVRRTHSDAPIYVVFGGYVMCEVGAKNHSWASTLLRMHDAFCIEVPATFHFTGGTWKFRYYL